MLNIGKTDKNIEYLLFILMLTSKYRISHTTHAHKATREALERLYKRPR